MASELHVSARPAVEREEAVRIASLLWGCDATQTQSAKELGSHQDRNYKISLDGAHYTGAAVFKIANPSWPLTALEAQDAALEHLAKPFQTAKIDIPRPIPALDGSLRCLHEASDGVIYPLRMLSYVEGTPLTDVKYLSPVTIADLGRLAGNSAAALADFNHPGLDRELGQWDLHCAEPVARSLIPSIVNAGDRNAVSAAVESAMAFLKPIIPHLPRQAIHGDITDDNVVATEDEAGRLRPHGIIDFGDLSRGWRVAELAVTCSCVLRHRSEDPLTIVHAVRAFSAIIPLTEEEIAAIWPLIVLRGAVLVASGEHQRKLDPDNPSVTGPLQSEWKIFRVANSIPFEVAEEGIRAALRLPRSARFASQRAALASASPLFPAVDINKLSIVDLSTTSKAIHSGAHLGGAETELKLLHAAASCGYMAVTRWNEARVTRSAPNIAQSSPTVALQIQGYAPALIGCAAPWDGSVILASSSSLALRSDAGMLIVNGTFAPLVASGINVKAGTALGSIQGAFAVQMLLLEDIAVGGFVTPGYLREGWAALSPDPSPLFGVSLAAPVDEPDQLLARRKVHLADVQEHYYMEPMRMERGWKQYLIDMDGRTYVDMVNNVAAIGHSHPRLAEAVNDQMHLLNTNSRFHYAAVAELCEKLTATAPKELDTVLLVNSGSEAVDLALRIAQVVTKRQDIIAVLEAYHGCGIL